MLGKLIKHEWKAVWKFLTAINAFMICLTVIGSIGVIVLGGIQNDLPEFFSTILGLSVMIYILSIFAVSIATTVYLGVRFYNSMFGSEGYLTHTLPATVMQLIAAKGLVAVCWVAICGIIMLFSIFTLVICGTIAMGSPIGRQELSMFWGELQTTFSSMGTSLPYMCFLYGGSMLFGCFSSVSTMYASAAIGQLFDKHRILAAVGVYFGFSMITQIFASFTSITTTLLANQNGSLTINFSAWSLLLFTLLFTAATFFITYYITRKKLNLE